VSRAAHFHPEAETELFAAAAFYDAQAPGLGLEFLLEVERVAARTVEAPAVGAPYVAGTRRLLARRFPYAVVYRVRGEQVVEIVAVAHYRRRPGYWRRRL
jgi:plasmid stabilization system protein ParE